MKQLRTVLCLNALVCAATAACGTGTMRSNKALIEIAPEQAATITPTPSAASESALKSGIASSNVKVLEIPQNQESSLGQNTNTPTQFSSASPTPNASQAPRLSLEEEFAEVKKSCIGCHSSSDPNVAIFGFNASDLINWQLNINYIAELVQRSLMPREPITSEQLQQLRGFIMRIQEAKDKPTKALPTTFALKDAQRYCQACHNHYTVSTWNEAAKESGWKENAEAIYSRISAGTMPTFAISADEKLKLIQFAKTLFPPGQPLPSLTGPMSFAEASAYCRSCHNETKDSQWRTANTLTGWKTHKEKILNQVSKKQMPLGVFPDDQRQRLLLFINSL